MTDHESIWLQPKCCASPGEDRLWCEDPLVECDVCGAPAIRFIRADIVDGLRSERDRLREAAEYALEALEFAYMNAREQPREAAMLRAALSPADPAAPPASNDRSIIAGQGGDE